VGRPAGEVQRGRTAPDPRLPEARRDPPRGRGSDRAGVRSLRKGERPEMIRRLQVSDPRLARLRAAVRTDPRARAKAFVVIVALLTAVALLIAPPATVTYSVGEVARGAIRAPRSVSFISESLTEAERSKAEAAVPKQVTTDPTILANAAARIQSAVTAIGR